MVALSEPAVVERTTTLETLLETPAGKRLMTCIQCGTCAGTCPYGDHMDFAPRLVINMLRGGFIDEVIKSDSLLRCVACYACLAKCPRGIRLTDVLLPLVKEQVLINRTEMPAEFQKSLENMNRYGNPMGESPRKRAAWTATAGAKIPLLAEVKPFGKNFFDLFDFLSSNVLLPVGGLAIAVLGGWVLSRKDFAAGMNQGFQGEPWHGRLLYAILKFVTPVLILLILLSSLGVIKLG